jgi:GTP-binding protein Era
MPNVGKSTLMNHLTGEKVAIVSAKPQTTRSRILGVVTREKHQIVLLDTPGLQEGKSALDSMMRRTSLATLEEVDVVLYMADITRLKPAFNEQAKTLIVESGKPAILGLNKIDLAKQDDIIDALARLSQWHEFADFVPFSAQTGQNVERLEEVIVSHLEECPPLYPPDIFTDQDEGFYISELAREKILLLSRQEVPHCAAVLVEHREFDEERNFMRIHCRIIVEKDSQKKILIGKGGTMIKEIGSRTRVELERLLGVKIFLDLLVSVKKNWRNDPRVLNSLGYPLQ